MRNPHLLAKDPKGRGQKSCSEEVWVTGGAYCAFMFPGDGIA